MCQKLLADARDGSSFSGMQVTTRAILEMNAPPEVVFDAAAMDYAGFAGVFPGYGLIPRIDQITLEAGDELREGSVRLIHNGDGSVLRERVDVLKRPEAHAYNLHGFVFPFSLLVREAVGAWSFHARGTGTHVVWNYQFVLTSPLAWPLAAPIIKIFFRGAMARCLGLVKARVEGSAA